MGKKRSIIILVDVREKEEVAELAYDVPTLLIFL